MIVSRLELCEAQSASASASQSSHQSDRRAVSCCSRAPRNKSRSARLCVVASLRRTSHAPVHRAARSMPARAAPLTQDRNGRFGSPVPWFRPVLRHDARRRHATQKDARRATPRHATPVLSAVATPDGNGPRIPAPTEHNSGWPKLRDTGLHLIGLSPYRLASRARVRRYVAEMRTWVWRCLSAGSAAEKLPRVSSSLYVALSGNACFRIGILPSPMMHCASVCSMGIRSSRGRCPMSLHRHCLCAPDCQLHSSQVEPLDVGARACVFQSAETAEFLVPQRTSRSRDLASRRHEHRPGDILDDLS